MKGLASIASIGVILALAGCYHATIVTGLPASAETVDKQWAAGWLWGLVPPKTVETAAKCKSGVSKVETQLSFVNQLVNFLTGGIFTPMAITVTCAGGGRAEIQGAPTVLLGANASMEQAREAFSGAVRLALDTKRPVYVAF